ncbi:MAG: site-2 protease family protein [Deltaproteobacteria bacterium]|nr:site-2 protease family protein [Deltaproteobacteria bacterium]
MIQEYIQRLAITAPPIIISLTVHECAHAWAALYMGDPTAKMLGRLTLNPLKHLDPIGTIMLFFSGLFGWAKPVPVNPRNFRDYKRGEIIVSAAGPVSNLALAVACAVLLKIMAAFEPMAAAAAPWLFTPLYLMTQFGVIINVAMAVFNMVPIPPLDGSHILAVLLPPASARAFARIRPYGFMILLLFIATDTFSKIFAPVIYLLAGTLLGGSL